MSIKSSKHYWKWKTQNQEKWLSFDSKTSWVSSKQFGKYSWHLQCYSKSKLLSEFVEIYMDNTTICSECFSMEACLPKVTISFLEIMSTEGGKEFKLFAYYSRLRSNIPKKCIFWEETMNLLRLPVFMAFLKNVIID